MQIVIPSRRRVGLAARCQRFFPGSIVCVAESEETEYQDRCRQIVTHPDSVSGTGPLWQWMLDHWPDECVVIVDDDVSGLVCLTNICKRDIEPGAAWLHVLANAEQMARDAGANVFYFNPAWDVRKYIPLSPFSFCAWGDGVVGVIGRKLRFSQNLLLRESLDFALQNLLHYRIVWMDQRFSFVHDRGGLVGGNSANRDSERDRQELEWLQRRWGKYLKIIPLKGTVRLQMKVQRGISNPLT